MMIIIIQFNPNPGRILSLAVNESTQQLYAGFNNTSLVIYNDYDYDASSNGAHLSTCLIDKHRHTCFHQNVWYDED